MKKHFFISIIFISVLFSYCIAQTTNFQWVKGFGGKNNDYSASIAVDGIGNVYTTGNFVDTVDFDPGISTYSLVSLSGYRDIFVSKLDATGNFLWAKQIGGGVDDSGNSITTDPSGNIYITGNFKNVVDFDPGPGVFNLGSPSYCDDIFVLKLDPSGDFVWAKQMGFNGTAVGNSIVLDQVGNVYTIGYFIDSVDFDPGVGNFILDAINGNTFVSKLDASGNFVWAKQIAGGSPNNRGHSVSVDNLGNIYTTGVFQTVGSDFDPGPATFTLSTTGSYDVFILKLNAGGNFLWAKQIGGISAELSYSSVLDASGNIYVAGHFLGTTDFDPGIGTYTISSVGSGDAFITKLDASGNFVWAKTISGNYTQTAYAVTADASSNVYTTGFFQNTTDFDPGPGTFNLTTVGNGYDIYISKLNSSGNFIWAKQFGRATPGGAGNFGITVDALDNVYTTSAFGDSTNFDTGGTNTILIPKGAVDVFVHKMSQGFAGVKENSLQNSITISPNPTSGKINFSFTNNSQNTCLKIINTTGQIIIQKNNITSNECSIDISEEASGIYILELICEGNISRTKLIKI